MLGTACLGKVSFLRNCPLWFLKISSFSLPHVVLAEYVRTTAERWCGCLEESLVLWFIPYICCDSRNHLFVYWALREGRIQVQHVWVLLRSCLREQVQTLASYRSFSDVSYSASPASPDGSQASRCASAFWLCPGSGCPVPGCPGQGDWACHAGARLMLARAARSIVALRSVKAKFFPRRSTNNSAVPGCLNTPLP